MASNMRAQEQKILAAGNGILRLQPAWVARYFLPPGRRLGPPEAAYNVGERRWMRQ